MRVSSAWRWWAGISAALATGLMTMLFHRSDNGTFLGRYSTSYMLQLVLMMAFVGGSLGMAFWTFWRPLPDLRRWLPDGRALWLGLAGGLGALTVLWIVLPGARFQPAIALFSMVLILVGSGVLLWAARSATRTLPAWTGAVLLGLAVLLLILTTVRYLGHVPPSLMFDEAWLANWGHSMYITGKPYISMYPTLSPARTQLASSWMVVMGMWLNATAITLPMSRLFWLLLYLVSVPFVYAAARRLYGPIAAVIAAIIALLLPLPHNYVRFDPAVALALAVAIYAWVRGEQDQKPIWFMVAGFATAMTLEGHLFSIRWIFAAGMIVTALYIRYIWRTHRWTYAPFWAFLIGGVAGSALYLVLHSVVWGIPISDFISAASGGYSVESQLGAGSGTGLSKILTLMVDWVREYVVRTPLEVALLGAGLVFWAQRRQAADRGFLCFFILGTLSLFPILPKPNIYYWIHHAPFVAIGGGAMLAAAVDQGRQWQVKSVVAALLPALLLTAHILYSGETATQNVDQVIALSYTLDHDLPPEIRRVSAWQSYYFGLSKREFTNIENFYILPGDQWRSLLGIEPPQAIVLTRGLDDMHQVVYDYIQQAGLALARCYPLDIYGRRADVYLPPEYVPPTGPVNCSG